MFENKHCWTILSHFSGLGTLLLTIFSDFLGSPLPAPSREGHFGAILEPFWRPKGDPQRSHRRAPEELQEAQNEPQEAPGGPKGAPGGFRRPKMSPRRRQEAQNEPQAAPGAPK